MATPFGIASQQNPWVLSPFGNQAFGTFPGQGMSASQPYAQPLQQIVQSLHGVPYQLQQLQQQLLQLQQLQYVHQQHLLQLLQIVPAQLQQLQQLIQFVPHQIQQLQAQPFGAPLGLSGNNPFQPTSTINPINPFGGQAGPVM
jgi:hypothetical protein